MWNVDFVQFARLLDEINTAGLTEDQINTIAKRMGSDPLGVQEILDRASTCVSKLKPLMLKKSPLTEDQISEELAENGKVESVLTVDFSEIIGQLDEDVMDSFIDGLAVRLGGEIPLDSIEHNVIFADGDTLYLQVTATAADEDDDEVEPTE